MNVTLEPASTVTLPGRYALAEIWPAPAPTSTWSGSAALAPLEMAMAAATARPVAAMLVMASRSPGCV